MSHLQPLRLHLHRFFLPYFDFEKLRVYFFRSFFFTIALAKRFKFKLGNIQVRKSYFIFIFFFIDTLKKSKLFANLFFSLYLRFPICLFFTLHNFSIPFYELMKDILCILWVNKSLKKTNILKRFLCDG